MHHTRRKSGHVSAHTSMTDVKKAVGVSDLAKGRRPQISRKSTPQTVLKLGKNPKTRERESEQQRWWDNDRESFPQYCMACEKQFLSSDESLLYCSDVCRKHDQTTSPSYSGAYDHESYGHSLPFYATGDPEPRDIIPRASPSRPSSTYFSPPTTPNTTQYTSAVSALKSLSIRPSSPPSPVSTPASIWPFARSAANSPSTSYTKPSNFYSSTYDGGYPSGYLYSTASGFGSERPLPSRKPSGYARPKSIELVTPMIGR
ncbi:ECL1/2/3 zinc binding protein [Microdochium nivale]|nr:ECL1/2/3 zinc binding protein [Microdochium nivale]